jgi:protein-disulfide isomerase
LRELTEYVARTCFPEIAVPQAIADLVDVAATAAPGCRSAGRSSAEAAARQDAFWEMCDALFVDQGRLEDPHVWTRAERLGAGVERFGADRRSDAARDRVRDDFRGGVKAGVATTPTLFAAGERRTSPLDLAALERLVQHPS